MLCYDMSGMTAGGVEKLNFLTFIFFKIQDKAFTQDGVQQAVKEPCYPRLFHDVPCEKAVVQVDGC